MSTCTDPPCLAPSGGEGLCCVRSRRFHLRLLTVSRFGELAKAWPRRSALPHFPPVIPRVARSLLVLLFSDSTSRGPQKRPAARRSLTLQSFSDGALWAAGRRSALHCSTCPCRSRVSGH